MIGSLGVNELPINITVEVNNGEQYYFYQSPISIILY